MSVILGSEIARLVFGYLQEEQLDEAATAFCKTSPYLVEEYDWLQRGYRAYKISDLCLVDVIREHCEIKYAVAEYIHTLPSSLGEDLKTQKSLSGKINSIFELLANLSKPNSNSRKRPYSLIGSSSTEATQSNELPGYEPPFKERRLSRKLILRQEGTPKQTTWTPTLKQNVDDTYVGDDDRDEENNIMSPEQASSVDRSRTETSQYPIFTETILENTQFQNVLVENINRILETSNDRIDVSADTGSHETMCNNSMQEQVKHAIDNIIMSTEQDPTFQQVLDDVVQHTANHEQTTRITFQANDPGSNSNETTQSPVPLKQRLRNRSQDKPRPNYNEIDQSTKKKRKGKVEVISNEIVSGPTTTVRTDSYVPLNQILYLNPDKSASTYSGQDLVYVNVGSCVPSFSQFRIDADTPMFLQDISLANNGTSTSLTPGSIINLPTIEQQIQPIQSLLPNVIIKDIVEVSQSKQNERAIKTTPSVSKIAVPAKVRSLTSPRRQSHVRSLNFTTSDDLVNESEKSGNKCSESGPAIKSQTTVITDDTNLKTSLEEVEPQQDSSDAVDFSKEFDEATVISVELSPPTGATQSESSKDEKPNETASGKKKPQTRRQCQKDLEMWNQMRQMKKGEWDNYLRQTVALEPGKTAANKKKIKKRRSKIRSKSASADVSAEKVADTTTDIEARLLEEALKSAKKPASPVIKSSSISESTKETKEPNQTNETKESKDAKETADTEQLKSSPTAVATTERTNAKKSRSPNKRASGGRKQLIQIKLPASAKKKSIVPTKVKWRAKSTAKRAVNPPAKQSQKSTVETSRIDPSQTIDIDLISPIEHPKELNNVVKGGVNLNSFLETPCKETPSSSFKYPVTPGFIVSSSIKTPGVRLTKDYDSLIKFPEYPTPSFAITPGRTKTPLSQTSSQKDGSSYNRATDYSSGSSYYKPDESDDIDKNLDALIKESVKENRNQMIECGLGVHPQQNIDSSNDQAASDGELSDSSSSTSSSSQTSSTSSCSSSPSMSPSADDNRSQAQAFKDVQDAKAMLQAQRTQQQLRLEQVRLRTMATLKTDKKIERFRKPKTKISTLQRNKAMEGSSMLKKPIQTLKMTGNSTPKVLPKHVSKSNPKTIATTPSKRKIATPRRVIYLDYKDAVKTSVRIVDKGKRIEQLLPQDYLRGCAAGLGIKLPPQCKQNNTDTAVQDAKPARPVTPTETIDAIESHIAKTSQYLSVEIATKLSCGNPVDTPNLLQQLQDTNDVIVNATTATTPEMGPPVTSTKRSSLVRELFGDGTMSDSDYMDTPVKASNSSRTQTNVAPVSHEVSTDGNKKDSNVKTVVSNSPKIDHKTATSTTAVDVSNVEDSNSKGSKLEKSKTDSSNSTDPSSSNSDTVDPIAKDSKRSSDLDQTSLNACPNDSASVDKDGNSKLPVPDESTSVECDKNHTPTKATDSQSESESDGDDYDDCIFISSLPMSNMPNIIYHNVISDTKECAINSSPKCLDMRPMTTFLDGRKIVMKTCDEVVLYTSPPKPVSIASSSGLKSVARKRTNSKTADSVRKVEERCRKVQKLSYDGADSVAPEKIARFKIVAKHKGPAETPSAKTSSSRAQPKIVQPSEELQQNAGASNSEIKTSSQQQHTKIPPLLKDMDINKVLGKIHPSKEVA